MTTYLEILYSLVCYNRVSLLALAFSIIIAIVISFIKKKWIRNVIYVLIIVVFLINYVYYNLFGMQLTLSNLLRAVNAFKFNNILLNKLNIVYIVLFLLPVGLLFIKEYPQKFHINTKIKVLALCFLSLFYMKAILVDNNGIYSKFNLYFNVQNSEENVKNFGLLASIGLDLTKTVFDFQEKKSIDFGAICDNDEVCEISEYLASQPLHDDNEYTGLFKGKNLIVFLAESFYQIGVDEELTPTLYKLIHSGFEFTNHYTPLYPVSTADSQFMLDNSLVPASNAWSMTEIIGNEVPYSYPRVLTGYKSFSYHNYDYDYYKRNEYMKTLGYETYMACGNGLERRMDCSLHQNSDLEMIKATVDDYIDEDKFLVYYTTMSGHANYDRNSPMVEKNYDKVKDLPYSENVKGYIATQIELDKALEFLIDELKSHDKLEDTVILLSGDHPPYILSLEEMNEVASEHIVSDFQKYHSNLIIYNSRIKHTVIQKESSTLDVLPTVLNLFGVDYDSRLLFGNDIFSPEKSLVIFSNRSFIYDGIWYDSKIQRVVKGQMSDEEKEKIEKSIYYKYRYSRLILENDYYKYVQE